MKIKDNEKARKEYESFMNEQFKILQGHFGRCMLRCYNKFFEIEFRDTKNNGGQNEFNNRTNQTRS